MRIVQSLAVVSLLALSAGSAQGEPIGVEGAMKLPIVDTHFHPMEWMDEGDVAGHMAKHNVVLWGGTSPRGKFGGYMEKAAALGDTYIFATGTSQQLATFKKGGLDALQDASHPVFKKYLGLMRRHLESGKVKTVAEIFVNTRSSAKPEWRRWKIKADSSAMQAIFALATEFEVPLMIHAQLDDDTAEQIVNLAASQPDGKLVMGHCGKDSTAAEARAVLEKAANVTCNLAYRSPPQEKGKDAQRIIWDDGGIKSDWRELIEAMADRFMVGIDDTHDWDQFDAVAKTIREDLLANLTAETAEKVAHKNARRIYGL